MRGEKITGVHLQPSERHVVWSLDICIGLNGIVLASSTWWMTLELARSESKHITSGQWGGICVSQQFLLHFPSDNASSCVFAEGGSLGVSLDLGQRQGILAFVTCAPYVKKCTALAIVKGCVCVWFFLTTYLWKIKLILGIFVVIGVPVFFLVHTYAR